MASLPSPTDPAAAGRMLRDWRQRRRRTQLELALAAGVSARHLSCVENGRARPSADLVVALASVLDVPPREQNRLLMAAGFAPRFGDRPLAGPEMAHIRSICQRLLDAAEPYPATILDDRWDVVAGNRASALFLRGVPDHLLRPVVNLFRLTLHPEGLAARTRNVEQWARHTVAQLRRMAERSGDPALEALLDEVTAYPNVAAILRGGIDDGDIQLVLPLRYAIDDVELAFITTLTVFATPADAAVGELAIEICLPADDATEAYLRGGAPARRP